MKKLTKSCLALLFILLVVNCFLLTAEGAIPHLINYQGRLVNSSGNPLTGSYNLTFRIYDAETAGNLLWYDTFSVVIDKGIFNVLLGSNKALDLPFDKQYYLAIQVGSDPEMSPRQRMGSAGYAYIAETLEGKKTSDLLNRINHTGTQSPSTISPQGAGSGLNSDMVDGKNVGTGTDDIPVRSTVSSEMDSKISTHTSAYGHLSTSQMTELTGGGYTSLHYHPVVKSVQTGEVTSPYDMYYGSINVGISPVDINKSMVIIGGSNPAGGTIVTCGGRLTSNTNLKINFSSNGGRQFIFTWQVVEFY